MSVRNDELCVAGVGFEGREVTLLHGLQAASGAVLEQDAVVEFSQGEKPAFVGVSGDGAILPREDSDGVGLETVNVTRLKLEVWRVAGRNLVRKSISAPQAGPTMIFPRNGAQLIADGFGPAARGLALSARGDDLRWFVDGRPLAPREGGGDPVWRPDTPGFYLITAVDRRGAAAKARIRIRDPG